MGNVVFIGGEGGGIGGVGVVYVGLIILDGWGDSSVFFELKGEVMIEVREVSYCAYVEFWWRSVFF